MTEKLVPGAQYHEGLASNWSSGYASGAFQRRLAVVRSLLKEMVLPGSNWLDAGCGTGLLTRELSGMGALVTGVDASPKMISAAVSESLDAGQSISFRQVASIENIESPPKTYDGVLCSSVIEYVESPDEVFGEFARVLDTGGKLLFSVPNKWSLVRNTQKLCKQVAAWFGVDAFSYLDVSKREFARAGIEESLHKFGFSIDRIDTFDPILPGFMSKFGVGSLILVTAHLE